MQHNFYIICIHTAEGVVHLSRRPAGLRVAGAGKDRAFQHQCHAMRFHICLVECLVCILARVISHLIRLWHPFGFKRHGIADFIGVKVPFFLDVVHGVIPAVEGTAVLGLGSWRGKIAAFSNGLRCFRTLVIKGHDEYQVGNRNALGDRAVLAVDDRAGKIWAGAVVSIFDNSIIVHRAVEHAAGDCAVVGDLAGERALFDGAVVIEHRTLKLGDALIAAGDLERDFML